MQLIKLNRESESTGIWLNLSHESTMFTLIYLQKIDQLLPFYMDNGLARDVFSHLQTLFLRVKPNQIREFSNEFKLHSAKYFQ